MIYVNSIINKRNVTIHNIELEIEENGIYLLCGKNGSGKTTLIETMLFDTDSSHFRFTNPKEAKYWNSKWSLFAYVSQPIMYSEVVVLQYIKKMNPNICNDQILYYLKSLGLLPDILNKKYCYLSGGEQKKVAIISALLKNTPYVFLDEPTNYLDNNSVKQLEMILEKESKERRIVIITHDPRISVDFKCRMTLENGRIVTDLKKRKGDYSENYIPQIPKLNFGKFLFEFSKSVVLRITGLIMFLLLVSLLAYTNIEFDENIGELSGKYEESILAYYVGGGHDSLNVTYEKAENIQIAEELYETYISYEDIPGIASMENVKSLYMYDVEYQNRLEKQIISGKLSKNSIYSCPNKYVDQYLDTVGDIFGLAYTEGKLPKDGKSEVAISKALLIEYYQYDPELVSDAIGDIITINGKKYTIVGFCYYDIAIVSYVSEEDYGFYCYDNHTYSSFLERQLEYISKIDGEDSVKNLLVCVEDKDEKSVLDTLVQNYPATCYISKKFEEIFYKQQKKDMFIKWLIINSIISVLFSFIVGFVIKKSIYYNLNLIYDFGNYYLDRRNMMKKYFMIQILLYMIVGCLVMFFNVQIAKHSFVTNYYILIDCFFILVAVIFAYIKSLYEVK